jgi:hypothetical protein
MSINATPISHTSYYGTTFTADRADLHGGVTVTTRNRDQLQRLMSDVAEFTAWHRGNIWDQLNGFPGYDCIRFNIVE